MGLIFISHDLELVATFCDRVAIMYAGRVVEVCRATRAARGHPPLHARACWAACRGWTGRSSGCRCWPATPPGWRAADDPARGPHRQLRRAARKAVRAVDRVELLGGATARAFGLVGESGSGKSTVLRAIAGLITDLVGHAS